MKSKSLALAMLYAIGVWTPALAGSIVFQQDTCKEGEVWDDEQKKCVAKPAE